MKAESLKRQSETIENIYKKISHADTNGEFKIFIPHFVHVEENVKIQLIEDGYKVYKGQWDGNIINALIIEW
jgi:hypothetical protein